MEFTLLDPATGALGEAVGPCWGDPESRPFWKPVFDGIREVLDKRGLADATMVGLAGDNRPSKAAVEDLKALLPHTPWELHTHPDVRELHGQPVGYLCTVWGAPRFPAAGEPPRHGWRNPFRIAAFPREGACADTGPIEQGVALTRYLMLPESQLIAGGRGFGRVGADFWPVLKDGQGRYRASLIGRYPQTGGGGSLSIHCSDAALLGVGKTGPIATVRLELLRQGLQEAEARIAIERALLHPEAGARLGADRIARCEALLAERRSAMTCGGFDGWGWFVSSGWQERNRRLFDLAGEAQGSGGGR